MIKMAHNTVATGDKGRMPVSIVESPAGSASLTRSDHGGGGILRRM